MIGISNPWAHVDCEVWALVKAGEPHQSLVVNPRHKTAALLWALERGWEAWKTPYTARRAQSFMWGDARK